MEEPKVFQGVGPDEMVISIAEYEEMKKQIKTNREKQDYEYKIRQDIRNENFELKANIEELKKENQNLKDGIIKFVKIFGGKC